MRIETDGSFQLQKTNIIIQIVSLLVIRINFDLKKKYWIAFKLIIHDLTNSSSEVLSLVRLRPVMITEIHVEILSSFPVKQGLNPLVAWVAIRN